MEQRRRPFGGLELKRKDSGRRVQLNEEVDALLPLFSLREASKVCLWQAPVITKKGQKLSADIQLERLLGDLQGRPRLP